MYAPKNISAFMNHSRVEDNVTALQYTNRVIGIIIP